MTKIAVIYYSLYGHTKQLADTAAAAANLDSGVEASVFQVPETLSEEVLKVMGAAPRNTDPIATGQTLEDHDGYIFVIPTRYGRAVGQFSAFFDHTGGLWAKQALSKKFATFITSTGSQHGGQETTALTTIPFLAHHGIIYVPVGYAVNGLMEMGEIVGGSPWGAGTLAGSDGSRQPTKLELEIVEGHAKYFSGVVGQFIRGKTA